MTQTAPPSDTLNPHAEGSLVIRRGQILVYRIFDVAAEIDLLAAENILSLKRGESRVRIATGKSTSTPSIIIRNAPIRVHLGEVDVTNGGAVVRAEVVATVWDYGVISICFQIPLRDRPWKSLVDQAVELSGTNPYSVNMEEAAHRKCIEIAEMLKNTFKKPNESKIVEDYIIYFLEHIDGITNAADLVAKADLPELILAETQERLSSKARDGVMENLYQYSVNDLVLIDWNSAIVLEKGGQRDVVDVLEFAVTHLLELRYYDEMLDHRLTELYDAIEAGREKLWKRTKFVQLSHDANTKFIEFSEFMERIDNSLKVVGDFYLATLFRGAGRRFRIRDWQQSITRKMNLLAQVSEMLQGESNVRMSHLLEVIVIVLIGFELFSAMVKIH